MAKDNPSGPLNTLDLSAVDLCKMMLRCGVKHLTPSAIGKWVQEGCPRNQNKNYSMPDVLAWHINDRAERPHLPPAETDEMEKAKLKQVIARTKAIDQARLAAEKKLIDREDVVADWMLLLHSFRAGLTTLTRVLVKEVVGQPEAVVKTKLEERINDVLKSFAEGWDGAGDIPKGKGQ
jgi:hypothetical protein